MNFCTFLGVNFSLNCLRLSIFTMVALKRSVEDYNDNSMLYFCIAVILSMILYSLGILLQWVFYQKGNFWHKNGVDVGFCYDHIQELQNPENFITENGMELDQVQNQDKNAKVPDWLKELKGHWMIE